MVAFLVLVALVVALAFAGVSIYNGLVSRRNAYKNAYSQIDVQLKRRHDLIPNLVETAKGYLKHERETLEAVIAARNGAVAAARNAAASPGKITWICPPIASVNAWPMLRYGTERMDTLASCLNCSISK